MNISMIESLIYGLVCGFAEFLPISSTAHRNILNCLFGVDHEEPLMAMFLHIGALLALLVSSRSLLQRLQRELEVKRIARRRSRRQPDEMAVLDTRIFLCLTNWSRTKRMRYTKKPLPTYSIWQRFRFTGTHLSRSEATPDTPKTARRYTAVHRQICASNFASNTGSSPANTHSHTMPFFQNGFMVRV